MAKQKVLVYYTNNYPLGGTTEEAFMKSEIAALSCAFSSVLVTPLRKESDCLDISAWPENVYLDSRLTEKSRIQGRLRYLHLLHPQMLLAVLSDRTALKSRHLLYYLIRSFQEGLAVKRYCNDLFREGKSNKIQYTFYSFWFAEASIGLGLLPKRKISRWISRAHRYDLYDDCVPFRSRYFRELSFRNLDKVLACSKQGADYLSNRYPKWKNKISTLYLGTAKPDRIPDYEYDPDIVRFITVARLEPVKRHILTFNILNDLADKFPDKKFKWTVAGGGSLEEKLMELSSSASKVNLEVDFRGEMPNVQVHRLLESQSFDWMIMLSDSEGLPISFAEAMSYGIPAIATDVGGVREEVIAGETGILLSSNPSISELVSHIEPYLSDGEKYHQLRKTAMKYWNDNLNEIELKKALACSLSDNFIKQ